MSELPSLELARLGIKVEDAFWDVKKKDLQVYTGCLYLSVSAMVHCPYWTEMDLQPQKKADSSFVSSKGLILLYVALSFCFSPTPNESWKQTHCRSSQGHMQLCKKGHRL